MHGTVKRVLTHSPTAVFFFFSFSFSFLSFLSFFFLGGSAPAASFFAGRLEGTVASASTGSSGGIWGQSAANSSTLR
jgi:hypothetical protein